MFKKLCILALTISTSYAMEAFTPTPTGDSSGVKQTIDEFKQLPITNKNETNDKTDTNNIEEEFDNLNINETLQQLNNINNENNNATKKNKVSDNKSTSKKIFFYKPDDETNGKNLNRINDKKQRKNTHLKLTNKNRINVINNEIQDNFTLNKNRINLFDEEKQHSKKIDPNRINDNTINIKTNNVDNDAEKYEMFKFFDDKADLELSAEDDLNTAVMYSGADDIKEFMSLFPSDKQFFKAEEYGYKPNKIDVHNKFTQTCQKFLLDVIKHHEITEQMMSNFCNSGAFKDCVDAELEPQVILEDVYKSNMKPPYISKIDSDFLNGQVNYVIRQASSHTNRIKWHKYGISSWQKQLQISETEASQIYWDSFWSNYPSFK